MKYDDWFHTSGDVLGSMNGTYQKFPSDQEYADYSRELDQEELEEYREHLRKLEQEKRELIVDKILDDLYDDSYEAVLRRATELHKKNNVRG